MEVAAVVLGVKQVLVVRTFVCVVLDAAQHQTFRQGAKEQVLISVRPGACGNGVDLAFDRLHRILDRALLESLDVRDLLGRIHGGLLRKQGGIGDVDLVIGVDTAGHEHKCILASHQSYLDIDAVDQEFILQEHVHVETAHHIGDTTPDDVRSSVHEPCISHGHDADLNGIHASGHILIRVGRRGHERTVPRRRLD